MHDDRAPRHVTRATASAECVQFSDTMLPPSYMISDKDRASSIWDEPENVRVIGTILSSEDASRIRSLAHRLHVDIGSIDFLNTPTDDLVFLEVNYVTDWRYFEGIAGDRRVSDAVLSYFSPED